MINDLHNKLRARIVGVLIVLAYSMLTYDLTKNVPWGVFFDIVSGLSVIGIAALMYPIFKTPRNTLLNWTYVCSKLTEGELMIIGGAFILSPTLVSNRSFIYGNIHIYFFILGALLLYVLLYRTLVVPKWLSLWGMLATLVLLVTTLLKLFGISEAWLDAMVMPMIVNEVVLAIWLMVKGFRTPMSN